MEQHEVEAILNCHKTPLYCFDLDILNKRIAYLKEKLPGITLCYAMKANSFIVEEMNHLVDKFEVCSFGELNTCRYHRIPLEKVVLSGVYKGYEDLENIFIHNENIGVYGIESLSQFEMIHQLAWQYKKVSHVILRLSSKNQFGMDPQVICDIIEKYKNDDYIHIDGIQYFTGTQKHSLKRIGREIQKMKEFMDELYERYQFVVETVEYGPGFPVSYFDETFDEDSYLDQVCELFKQLGDVQLVLELGRSMAACCGSYLTSVVDLKTNQKTNYAIVDGGIHHLVYYGGNLAMALPPLQLYQNHHIQGEMKDYMVCGSLCTVNDILIKQLKVADLRLNDILIFKQTGAYCMMEGISLFLSRELPAVLLKKNNQLTCVREHIMTDIFNRG